ncbi:MAG: family 78 glycoside hydrolase catalytic domain [Flavobacteriaceae bacterium]
MKRILFLLIALQAFLTFAQHESKKGIWYGPTDDVPNYEWNAQWIWMADSVSSQVMLARKTFEILKVPQEAFLRITASSQYQLFVNGTYAGRGPARSAPHHQSFDILNIAPLLKRAKNVIAVRVHVQNEKFSYHSKGRAGLLVQLDLPLEENNHTIHTDDSWKVSPDDSWDSAAPKISRFQQIVNDRVDLRSYPRGWKTSTFDDASWSNATILYRTEGWPEVQKNSSPGARMVPWVNLVARDIPYLLEKRIRAENLRQATQIDLSDFSGSVPFKEEIDKRFEDRIDKYSEGAEPLAIPISAKGKAWLFLFDFEQVLNGTPFLEIQGSSGTEVEILGAPFMINDTFTYKVVDSEFRDKLILSGEKDLWEATYFKPVRYLGIIVHNPKATVKLFTVGTRQIRYPFELKGAMDAKDLSWIKEYMDATAKTIDVCTTDAFTDNYRERRQYAQTGYYASLGNYYLFGDTSLQRRYLIQTAQEQEANGIMPAYAPAASDDYMIILDSNCLWIRSLHDYLLHSGDYKTARDLVPAARKLMLLLHSFTNEMGLIDDPPYAYWLDHALLDRRGANLNLNGHYLGALEDFADILEWLDGKEESASYKEKAKILRSNLRTHLWDDKRGLFADALIDGKRSQMFSEQSNAAALALNIASQEQADRIASQLLVKDQHNYVRRNSGLIMVTPAMSYYLHKGLCQYGYVDASFQMFRGRFDKMLAQNNNGTLWEEWFLNGTGRSGELQTGRTRSDAQTESAFAPALFAEFLLGVKPSKPGMTEVVIGNTKTQLENISGKIPTPQGILDVRWNNSKASKKLFLEVPGNMIVKVDLSGFDQISSKLIQVDGQKIEVNLSKSPYMILEEGKHQLKF